MLHERHKGVSLRRNDHDSYQDFDRRIREDQHTCRTQRESLSDTDWNRYLEMSDLLEMWLDVPPDLRMHFDDVKQTQVCRGGN